MQNSILDRIFKHWKTTSAGGIGGLLVIIGTFLVAQFDDDPNTIPQWNVLIPAVIGIFSSIFVGIMGSDDSATKTPRLP